MSAPGGTPGPRLPAAAREALTGFVRRAAAALPGQVARVVVFGPRPASDSGLPAGVLLRDPPAEREARRALLRILMETARPAVEAGLCVQIHPLRADDRESARGLTLWPRPGEQEEPA